jgi:hypothetical protein
MYICMHTCYIVRNSSQFPFNVKNVFLFRKLSVTLSNIFGTVPELRNAKRGEGGSKVAVEQRYRYVHFRKREGRIVY